MNKGNFQTKLRTGDEVIVISGTAGPVIKNIGINKNNIKKNLFILKISFFIY